MVRWTSLGANTRPSIDQIPEGLGHTEGERPGEAGHDRRTDADQCNENELHGYLRYHVGVKPETRTFIAAFLQGFTGAGLFNKLEIPGAPTRMFLPEPGEEDDDSGEGDGLLRKVQKRREHENQR